MHFKSTYSQPGFYHFSESSLLLAKYAVELYDQRVRVLDLFAGSGVVGRFFLENIQLDCSMTLIEVQKDFIPSLERNFDDLSVELLINDFRKISIKPFNLILANPPFYKKSDVRPSPCDKKNICQIRGFEWKEFFDWCSKHLTSSGDLIFLIPILGLDDINDFIKNKTVAIKELNAKEALVHVRLNIE